MTPTPDSIQAFARLWAALQSGGANENILARAQLDEAKWVEVCSAWAPFLSGSPEVREVFVAAFQAAGGPDAAPLPTEPPFPIPASDATPPVSPRAVLREGPLPQGASGEHDIDAPYSAPRVVLATPSYLLFPASEKAPAEPGSRPAAFAMPSFMRSPSHEPSEGLAVDRTAQARSTPGGDETMELKRYVPTPVLPFRDSGGPGPSGEEEERTLELADFVPRPALPFGRPLPAFPLHDGDDEDEETVERADAIPTLELKRPVLPVGRKR